MCTRAMGGGGGGFRNQRLPFSAKSGLGNFELEGADNSFSVTTGAGKKKTAQPFA